MIVYSIEIPLMAALILYNGISKTHCRLKQFHHAICILIKNNEIKFKSRESAGQSSDPGGQGEIGKIENESLYL